MADNQSYAGTERAGDAMGRYAQLAFMMRQIMGELATVTLVRVEAVEAVGEVAPVGKVDIRPLVNQLDGDNNAIEHGTIFDVPYFRLQGGRNAIIIDPVVGDIGIALFASRDISSVVANKAPANPGSRRSFDMADALYIGGVLNDTPEQYIRFDSAGNVEIKPASTVTIKAKLIVEQDIECQGTVTAQTDVIGAGKSLKSHIHNGVTGGTGTSGPPA